MVFHNMVTTNECRHVRPVPVHLQRIKNAFAGLFKQFWEKAPGQNWEKKIDLTAKLGEINNI